jgi:hypothetical protein
MRALGWAFFGLAAVYVGWSALRDGIYLGADVQQIERPYGVAYLHKCKYLTAAGVEEAIYPRVVIYSEAQAAAAPCPSRLAPDAALASAAAPAIAPPTPTVAPPAPHSGSDMFSDFSDVEPQQPSGVDAFLAGVERLF